MISTFLKIRQDQEGAAGLSTSYGRGISSSSRGGATPRSPTPTLIAFNIMTSPLPTTQSLIQLTSHGLTAANFAEKEAPVPKISDSQLLIKVAFAGVNPVDAKHARGDFGAWTIGQTQGRECSGTVVAVGPAVREAGSFAVGDEVMAYCDGKEWAMVPGAFAQCTLTQPL